MCFDLQGKINHMIRVRCYARLSIKLDKAMLGRQQDISVWWRQINVTVENARRLFLQRSHLAFLNGHWYCKFNVLTWQKQLWSWLSGASSLEEYWLLYVSVLTLLWNQTRTKSPNNNHNKTRSPADCIMFFIITDANSTLHERQKQRTVLKCRCLVGRLANDALLAS